MRKIIVYIIMSPFCTNCGRELEENWAVCPECGKFLNEASVPQTHLTTPTQVQTRPQPHRTQPYQYTTTEVGGGNKFGAGSLACGILGLLFGFFYGFLLIGFGFPIFRIVAVILGGIGISKDENKSMAIVGLVLGVIGLVLYFLGGISSLFSWHYW